MSDPIADGRVVVDRFDAVSSCGIYVLTHFHADHCVGLSDDWCAGRIYSTEITKRLALARFAQLDETRFVTLHYNEPQVVVAAADGGGGGDLFQTLDDTVAATGAEEEADEEWLTLTALPANHCIGSLMLLIDCAPSNVRVLHTGDFRFHRSMLQWSALRDAVNVGDGIDVVYLDATFVDGRLETLPSRATATRQILRAIESVDASVRIDLEASMIGYEALLAHIYRRFQAPICVTDATRMAQLRAADGVRLSETDLDDDDTVS